MGRVYGVCSKVCQHRWQVKLFITKLLTATKWKSGQNLSAKFVSLLQTCLQVLCIGTYGEQALAPLEGAGAHTMLRCIPVRPAPELLLLHGDRTLACMSLSAGSYTQVNHWGWKVITWFCHICSLSNIGQNISPQLLSSYTPERLESWSNAPTARI